MKVFPKEILDDLKKFIEDHKQIKSYGFGDMGKLDPIDREYPLLWVVPSESTIHPTHIQMGYIMFVLDKQVLEYDNIEDIHSNTFVIGNDILSYFYRDSGNILEDRGWVMNNEVKAQMTKENSTDMVLYGTRFDFLLDVENDVNICEIPLNIN